MEISTTRTTQHVTDARLAEILERPRLRHPLLRPHVHGGVDPRRGVARGSHHALRTADPRPGDGRPALRAGDLRGDEGLPSRRRLHLGLPARGQRRADGALQPPARAARAGARRLRPGRRGPGDRRPAVGARGGVRREEPLPAPLHVRLREVPGSAPGQARHLHGDRQPCRPLLQQGSGADHPVAHHRVHPRRPRWHGRGQDRRQLRVVPDRPAGGDGAGLRPGRLPRRPGGPLRRGARRHEHVLRLRRRPHRHPCARHHPRGHHPRQHHRAGREDGPPGRGAPHLDRRVARRRHQRRDQRGLRVRHRGRRHAGRRAAAGTAARPPRSTEAGEVTMAIRQALVDIQYGRADDTFGWMHRIC